jgi:hypothetical protein
VASSSMQSNVHYALVPCRQSPLISQLAFRAQFINLLYTSLFYFISSASHRYVVILNSFAWTHLSLAKKRNGKKVLIQCCIIPIVQIRRETTSAK